MGNKYNYKPLIAASLLLGAGGAFGQTVPSTIEHCATIAGNDERLACYDQITARNTAGNAHTSPAGVSTQSPSQAARPSSDSSRMSQHWELDEGSKRGTFNFVPHRENYLLATYNNRPNEAPYQPFRVLDPDVQLSHGELAFQLGFKLKMAERPANLPLDVWFGYTQRSFWQAGNQEASSPFRETNYQPEVMAVVPTNLNLFGTQLRFLNLGLVHESNGGGSTLSRSWNRVYLQAGLERGDFQLLARAWKRIKEDANNDDNPRINDYMGHGDLTGTYHWNGHEFSLLTRYNFHTDKGAAQLGWAFPVTERLKGYVQYFTGYGYTLVDYNAFQRVLGVGVSVTY